MSTRSLICIKRDKDKYECIYCHSDGYLKYNGAMLIDHYKEKEKVEKLIKLGNISCLERKIEPNPNFEHSFEYDKRQEDVVVAYGRDRGEKNQDSVMLNFDQMKDYGWIQYLYVFDESNTWKVAKLPDTELKDVKKELDKEYKALGIKRPKNLYGCMTPEEIKKERKRQNQEEM